MKNKFDEEMEKEGSEKKKKKRTTPHGKEQKNIYSNMKWYNEEIYPRELLPLVEGMQKKGR